MSTAVVDITPLVEAEASAAEITPAAEAANVGLPASDLPAKDEKVVDAETKESEAKAGDKPEDGKGKTEKAASTTEAVKIPKAADVHKTLEEFFKEATPEGKEKLQALNSQLRDLYAGLKEAQSTSKDVAEVVKASEELESLVSATDQLLYDSADPTKAAELVQNIWNDVSENSTPEAFTGFAVSALDKLKTESPAAYYEQVVTPLYQHALETTGMVDAVRGLINAWNSGDKEALKSGISGIAQHLQEIGGKVQEHTKAQETAKATAAQEAYTNSVRTETETILNKGLGKALLPILNGTELGTYERDVQLTVAREMRQEFFKRIQADKPYWDALNAAYAKRDSARIKQLYTTKVNNLADDVTKTVIDRMYPNGLEKRSAKAKAIAVVKGEYVDFAEGKFLRVKSKPSDLDMTVRKADTMLIAGRGVRKDGTKVCWRKN